MSDAFPAIVTRIGGKSRRLVLEKQWIRAIASGDIGRDTPIRYETDPDEVYECLARDCAELDVIFANLLGEELRTQPRNGEPSPTVTVAFADNRVQATETLRSPPVPALIPPVPSGAGNLRAVQLFQEAPVNASAPTVPPAVRSALLPLWRYADFEGRSGRAEYWRFMLSIWGATTCLVLLAAMMKAPAILGLTGLLALAVLVPALAVTARRFHDLNLSGKWILAWIGLCFFVPVVTLAVLVVMAIPGKSEPNRFGPAPGP